MSLTDADIDEMLFRQELTPAGAAKLRAKRALDAYGPLTDAIEKNSFRDYLQRASDRFKMTTDRQGPKRTLITLEPIPRAFDGFKDHKGPLGIACPCPRCSPGYLSASIH